MRTFCLLLTLALCSGCQDAVDRLSEEYRERYDAKSAAIEEVLNAAPELPEAPGTYSAILSAKKKLKTLEAVVANPDQFEEEELKIAQEQLNIGNRILKEFQEEAAIDPSLKISFVQGKEQNAFSLLLSEAGTQSPYEEFRERNLGGAAWYFAGPSYSDVDAAREWYEQYLAMKYLLLIRQVDIVPPKHLGQDSAGNEEFDRGAIECYAYLMDLDTKECLHSYHFAAPNQASPASVAGFEFFMPPDPEDAVKVFTSRLYGVTHDFATAIAAELSENVTAEYQIVRDLLGTRLERNE